MSLSNNPTFLQLIKAIQSLELQGVTGNPPFMASNNVLAAPVNARIDDYIINAGTGNISIGNLTNQAVGAVVRITALSPLTVVFVGSIRGAAGIDGTSFLVLARYDNELVLRLAHPTGITGDAYFVGPIGGPTTVFIWDISVSDWVDIGPIEGAKGDPGRNPEIQRGSTHIQWRLVGDLAWTNIIALEELKGQNAEFRRGTTHIQWRWTNDPTWIDLIAIADIKGDPGDVGSRFDGFISYGGVNYYFVRIGNIVQSSLNGTIGTVSGTPNVPLGFRPVTDIFFPSNQQQGATMKMMTILINGNISASLPLAGATTFSYSWVTNDPPPV
jgi:hypothetical protein